MNTSNNSSDPIINKYLDLRPTLPEEVAEIMDDLMRTREEYLKLLAIQSRTHWDLGMPDEWHIQKF